MGRGTQDRHAPQQTREEQARRPQGTRAIVASAIVHPATTLARLAEGPARPGLGIGLTAAVGVLYALVAAGLALLDHEPVVQPWLQIPTEHYYAAQALFTLPVVLAGVVAGAGAFHLVARWLGGHTDFDRALVAVSIAYALPTLLMWAVEAVSIAVLLSTPLTTEAWLTATASGLGSAFVAGYQYVAFAWYGLLFVLAARHTAGLRLLPSLLVALATLATTGLLQFTFIR